LTVVDPTGGRRDVVARWRGPVTVGELVAACGLETPYAGAAVWVDGRATAPDELLDTAGVYTGVTVGLSPSAAPARDDPAARPHLAVVGGPAAGAMVTLRPGGWVVGRGRHCDISVADPTVSSRHLALEVTPTGEVTASDLGSSNGTVVDGEPLAPGSRLRPGHMVGLGDSYLEVRPAAAADAVVHPVAAGLEVRRPPRLEAAPEGGEVVWPAPPAAPGGHSLPLASALVPLVLGGILFAVTRQVLMLLFVLMSPLLAVTTTVTDRRSGRARYRREVDAYRQAVDAAGAETSDRLRAEARARRAAHPDPAAVAAVAAGPRRRLWERRAADGDFLPVRAGLATLPAYLRRRQVPALGADELEPLAVPAVPVTLSLAHSGVIGVAPPTPAPGRPVAYDAGAVATWMVAQAVTFSGPADLRLAVIAPPPAAGDGRDLESRWGWCRWLPHAQGAAPGGPPALGTTAATAEARIRELAELVDHRHRRQDRAAAATPAGPAVLAVLDPAHDVRRIPGAEVVLQRGPAVGVYALCVEEGEGFLPSECRAVVIAGQDGRGRLRRSGAPDVEAIALDGVDARWCDHLGRALGPLVDPEIAVAGGALPASVRLADLVEASSPAVVAARWAAGGRATAAVVGLGVEGPFALDLKADGPHGLVAGTTGAGKSEFLQTLVASLAVANRPDALNFLLIDYKGGSAFRDCARLPHTVGVVTDLDTHLTERALVSLSAELKRREQVLADAGAVDIDDYVGRRQPGGPLPRLVIVIDEFAGLVTELPEFVTGLVGIAQRGRSLGIHLVLATQRPSGVVSPEIRANTNLRVALRVTSPSESVDIIDGPHAASISPATPGRAYALTGHSALSLFQSARVGGPAAAGGAGPDAELAVAVTTWADAGRPPALVAHPVAAPPTPAPRPDVAAPAGPVPGPAPDPDDTDLSRLATTLTVAAASAAIPAQRQPWLPPLPAVLTLAALPAPGGPVPGRPRPVAVGLVDLPARQAQEPFVYDPAAGRHLLVGGSPGTGRTTLLRALACALAGAHRPEDLWLYAVDCGGGDLRRLAALPHCGAVVTRTEVDRADRLLGRLRRETERRLEVLAVGGHADISEQRSAAAPAERMPYLVVMIDRWEGFMSAFDQVDNGRLTDAVLDVAREGGSVGIRLVVTGDRTVLLGKLAGMVDDRLCLALTEPADYALAGMDPRRVPPLLGPGRAVRSGDQAEVQVAVPGTGPSGAAQAEAVTALVRRWQLDAAPAGVPAAAPFRVDPLPIRVTWADVAPPPAARPARPAWTLLGLGGDELHPVGVDLLDAGGGMVVAGPRRSGRSNALAVMARSLAEGGCAVVVLCPRLSPLRRLRGAPGVVGVMDGDDPPPAALLEMINSVTGPLAVVVDDAPLLHGAPVAELLEMVARDGPDQGHVSVVAGTADELLRPMRGFIVEVRQARTGLLLCPESHLHAEVVGARLPRSAVFSQPPGRGILVNAGRHVALQVPWLEPAAPA
jgi:S-DNA-T family DNA segregation ATPase FtsK/SpoIIIE